MSSSLPRINSQFQPLLLRGHEKSITTVKYNSDGDLLFSAAKDNRPTAWYADTGERLGTYNAPDQKGAVWDLDASWDSQYIITACADAQARLFEVSTGRYLAKMPHKGVVRSVCWGEGTKFATASDPFHTREVGLISIFDFPTSDILSEVTCTCKKADGVCSCVALHAPKFEIHADENNKATSIAWTKADEHIIVGFDNGLIVKYDVETGREIVRKTGIHTDRINRLSFNKDKTLLVTASKDCTAVLIDPIELEIIRTYRTDRPVNGAVISPTHPHILMGGGQEAMNVTTTSSSQGKFETRFFHLVYGEEFARVKGHFGPINALAVHPFGKSYASGSEDGFIRLHHFDATYLNAPDLIPEDIKK